MAIKYSEINTDELLFTPLPDYVYIPSQRISWINKSDKSKLIIQTPKIVAESYGIPKEGFHYG